MVAQDNLQTPLLRAQEITKRFGTLVANDAVDLEIARGEIHALLGENGAGKSTLVKMFFGSLQPDSGQIFWKQKPVSVTSPSVARDLGIGMVFQHFSLFDALTVSENIALSFGTSIKPEDVPARALALSEEYGLPLDPHALVGDLSVGERQRIEIIRCLLQDPQLIILDEPTSVLTPQEAERLFETLQRLVDEGRSILYISHRLDEVQRICDRATILRHGVVVDACDPRKETAGSLAAKMVGGDIGQVRRERMSGIKDDVLLSLKSVSMSAVTPFATPLSNINLNVRAGEVIGIAGVAGNGQSELFDAISGERLCEGEISQEETRVEKLNISDRRRLGAAYIAEERLGHSAIPGMTLSENLLLSRHASDHTSLLKMGGINAIAFGALRSKIKDIVKIMDVRKSGENPAASSLSGGNLQKFIIGRELDRAPRILVVNQPTWGVDAGAAANIRQSLIDLARSGSAVLVISQDLDEIFEISDRIAVMSEGRLSEATPADEMTREKVGLLMTGIGSPAFQEQMIHAH